MNTKERVRQFILEFFYVSDPAELTDESPCSKAVSSIQPG